jgi:hypothetical protein
MHSTSGVGRLPEPEASHARVYPFVRGTSVGLLPLYRGSFTVVGLDEMDEEPGLGAALEGRGAAHLPLTSASGPRFHACPEDMIAGDGTPTGPVLSRSR